MCTLSHPAVLVSVWLYEPVVVMICPFQSIVSHTVVSLFPILEYPIVTFKVCTLSHPAVFVNVWVYVPVVVMIWPFQSYVSQVSTIEIPCVVSDIYIVFCTDVSSHGEFPYAVNVNITYPLSISVCPGVYVVFRDWLYANVPPFVVPLVLLVHNV